MEKIRYIDNNPDLGIKYNWDKITKLYRSLDIPPEYDFTEIIPIGDDNLTWYNLNSERSVGKTTNLLLYGMCMNVMYGTQIQLVRHRIEQASYYTELFRTIVDYKEAHYITTLTKGKYNSVKYFQKRFYLQLVDEKGKELERDSIPFCIALGADECYNLCSKYEAPRGDWIILDECFNDKNTPEEFVRFIHLHKTIVRERISDKIFILGNVLDINNIWYRQLTIHNEVRKLKYGQSKVVYTTEGMPIFVAFLKNNMPEKRKKFNKLHYGFNNPQINAITGNGSGWNVKTYPLTCMLKNKECIGKGVYFNYHDDLYLGGSFIMTDSGLYFEVHPCNYESCKNGDIQYTMHIAIEKNQCFFGSDDLSKFILKLMQAKRIVFNDNETGHTFEKFLSELKY